VIGGPCRPDFTEAQSQLICPSCRKSETRVVDSRDDESVVRRRRECLTARAASPPTSAWKRPRLFVVKKDGRREQYNRDKVLTGLRRACEKRPVSEAQMEEIVAGLERELFSRGENEVPTAMLGEKLMEALKAHRQGRLHPLRKRLPFVRRHRQLPSGVGRACQVKSGVRVRVKRRLPEGRRVGAAGLHDARLAGADVAPQSTTNSPCLPGARALVPAGFRSPFRGLRSAGAAAQRPRASRGVTLLNTPGTIDSDYRGPVGVLIANFGTEPFVVRAATGSRNSSSRRSRARFDERAELSTRPNGQAGGFGSTGGYVRRSGGRRSS
jgi:transcriptional regulator NrdR